MCDDAALVPVVMSWPAVAFWPAVAGTDEPWQELDSSSGRRSALVGLIYGAWRLFVSGDLGLLIASEVRFLLEVYLPVALFLGVAVQVWGARNPYSYRCR